MADNKLMFPIGFDLDSAVKNAQKDVDRVLRQLGNTINSKPLKLNVEIAAGSGSISEIQSKMKALEEEFNKLAEAQRIYNRTSGEFTPEAQKLIDEYAKLVSATQSYAQSLQQITAAARRHTDEQIKAQEKELKRYEDYWKRKEAENAKQAQADIAAADKARKVKQAALAAEQAADLKRYESWLALKDKEVQQAEAAELKKENIRRKSIARQNAAQQKAEDVRYEKYWQAAEKEAQKIEAAEAKKRAAYAASASAQRQAAHEQAQAAFKIAQALKAQETSLDAINAKLQIYQQQIRGQQIGSAEWNKSALEIRRLTEELQKASQQMADFQQKSFKGLSDSFTVGKVQALTRYRNELAKVEAEFNKLNQTGAAYDSKGGLTGAANQILKQRQAIIKQINQMLTTAADAQIQREKEINRIIEQRKAKADAIAAKRKAEQAAIQKNIDRLKEERRILNQQESSLNAINAKLQIQQQRLNAARFGSADYTKALNEVARLTQKLDEAKKKIDGLTKSTESGAQRQATAHSQVNKALSTQSSYIERLVKRLAVYYSLQQVGSFLSKVREVTAQFELQRVSLGAIIQDQNRANQLFSEIKSFALKSPLKIMDLTTYTKQVAAYRIETDKLFDTTKRLADVSVGLGVDMGRLVLAYGQVKAASYLRAAEVRQFTESGIPMLELLAEKFTELQGKMVSTEQVMDLISKRAVSFSMVEEIFNDMTSAGGMFYNMQEKQGNTLFGMWSKLGDAASVMYDQIGNTDSVHDAMEGMINLTTTLMRNWKNVARTLDVVGVAIGIYVIGLRNAAIASKALTLAESARLAILNAQVIKTPKLVAAIIGQNAATALSTKLTKLHTAAMVRQSMATNILTKNFWNLTAAMLSNPWVAAAAAIAAVATAVIHFTGNVDELQQKLDEVKSSSIMESDKSVRNFESLANAAVNAADGSKAQRDALEELKNTYGKIVPLDDLKIEKLRALKGNYEELTQAIRDNIAQQKLQGGISTINETYGADIQKFSKRLTDELRKGLNVYKDKTNITEKIFLSDAQIDRIKANVEKLARETGKSYSEVFAEALKKEGIGDVRMWGALQGALKGITQAYRDQEQEIKDLTKDMSGMFPEMGKFADNLESAKKQIENMTITAENGTFAYDKEVVQKSANAYIRAIRDALIEAKANVKIEDYMKVGTDGTTVIDWEGFKKAIQDGTAELKPELLKLVGVVQESYNGLVPSDAITQAVRNNLINIGNSMVFAGNKTKQGMDVMKKYLWDGKGSIEDHLKTLKDASKELEAEIFNYSNYIKQFGFWGIMRLKLMGVDVDALTTEFEGLKKQIQYVQGYVKEDEKKKRGGEKKRGGKKDDPRLSILQEMVSTLKQVNKEYEDLAKKEGKTKALADTQKVYADTFKKMQSLAENYNFKLPNLGVPTDAASLTKYLDAIKKAMQKLPKSEKAVLALQVDTDKINIDDAQKQIEKKLKDLQERIARTKTAKEFFDKMLNMTGDYKMSADITMSVYGDTGEGLQQQLADEIRSMFDVDGKTKIEIPVEVIDESNRINYLELERFAKAMLDAGSIGKDMYDKISKAAQDGQKEMAQQVLTWEKELAKAKDFETRKTDIIKTEWKRRREIINSKLSQREKERRLSLSREKQKQEIADIEVEEFQATERYIKIFGDLDNVATASLIRVREEIQKLIDKNKDLDPKNLKTLVKAYDDVDKTIKKRRIGDAIVSFPKDIKTAYDNLKTARKELAKAQLEAEKRETSEALTSARRKVKEAEERVKRLKDSSDNKAKTEAQNELNDAQKELALIEKQKTEAQKKVGEAQDAMTKAEDKVQQTWSEFKADVNNVADNFQQMANVLGSIKDLLGISSDSAEGLVFDSAINSLTTISSTLNLIITAQTVWNSVANMNPYVAIASAVLTIATALVSIFRGSNTKRQEGIIENLQTRIDNLTRAYERLQRAEEKAFGSEYISNYKQQISNLQAQYQAYMDQAQAERNKGKDADEAAARNYQNQALDTLDKIAEMRGKISEHFAGTDVASAARDFAQSWLEAKTSFENTTTAMEEKFKDLIQNMIIEAMAGKIMEEALKPFYTSIEAAAVDGQLTAEEIAQSARVGLGAIQSMNEGMEVLYSSLEQAGINMQEIYNKGEGFTGIARDIASASEESITGLAAGINTQNFYFARTLTEVEQIRLLLQGGSADVPSTDSLPTLDLVTLQTQSLSHLQAIEANTALTAQRCEIAAAKCTEIATKLSRVIKVSGNDFAVRTTLN